MSPRPHCEADCDKPCDYYDPDTDRHLCQEHAINEGRKAWFWNDRQRRWERD